MSTEIVTGTDLLRATLRNWNKSKNVSFIARDTGVANETLYGFMQGGQIAPEVLKSLAEILYYGHAIYDVEADRLRPAVKHEPKSLGVYPPPLDPALMPTFKGGPPPLRGGMVPPAKPKAKRAGWIE